MAAVRRTGKPDPQPADYLGLLDPVARVGGQRLPGASASGRGTFFPRKPGQVQPRLAEIFMCIPVPGRAVCGRGKRGL